MAKTLQGIVTSDSRDKTITVSITSRETHPLYRKQYSHTRKYTADDPKNEAHLGDKVEIAPCRPISKTKSYKLVKIVERSHGTVQLKDNVTEVAQEQKVGADQVAKAKLEEEEQLAEQENESKESELSSSNDEVRTAPSSKGDK